ncbi:DUF3530 family protein [Natronospirillum operosum]|nr:DUF3530 family protein [Natronospirillum operosum]
MPDWEAHARDLERRYEHLMPPGQYLLLQEGDLTMPSLWMEQTTAHPQGGVLIIHDDGQHPDWPRLIHDLRHHLPDAGWSTLSISIPPRPAPLVPERNREIDEPRPGSAAGSEPNLDFEPEVARRILLGVNELNDRGIQNTVLVGVGTGALYVTRSTVQELQMLAGPDQGIGLVLVGARPGDTAEIMPLLGQLTVPVLDVYLPGDHTNEAARQRRAAINRAGLTEITQVREQAWASANRSGPQVVTRRTWGWLRSNLAGTQRGIPAARAAQEAAEAAAAAAAAEEDDEDNAEADMDPPALPGEAI